MVGGSMWFCLLWRILAQPRPFPPSNIRALKCLSLHPSYPILHMSAPATKPESTATTPAGPMGEADPFTSIAAALDQVREALSSARAAPKAPTILVADAEAQMDVLRAEIASLKESTLRDLVQIDSLRKDAEDDAQAKMRAMASMVELHEGQRRMWEVRAEALQEKTAKEGEALATERAAVAQERELLAEQRGAVEAETRSLLEQRTTITQQLHSIIQSVQPNSPINMALSGRGPTTRPITPIESTIPSIRRTSLSSPFGTLDESNPRKRARSEGDPSTPTATLNISQQPTTPIQSPPAHCTPTPAQSPTRSPPPLPARGPPCRWGRPAVRAGATRDPRRPL
ncbi:hypothetical protein DFH07DRAFT_1031868 [Mycena maculata]|uniref:GDP/GTP exchange factor Sec2 N-terminal domain-containing protein n=1 Tax=Mycena maculata TaxID=230809 RepID=A0AAD7IX01_9AGAR|nr:hypothetical protein DFH07DRAFT_1031868 [Mycena maculata]